LGEDFQEVLRIVNLFVIQKVKQEDDHDDGGDDGGGGAADLRSAKQSILFCLI